MEENEKLKVESENVSNNTEKSKKIKVIVTVLVILLILAIGIFAGMLFSKNNTSNEVEKEDVNQVQNDVGKEEKENNQQGSAKKIDEAKPWVYDAEYEKNNEEKKLKPEYSDELYSTIDMLRIPYININSEDAKSVNNELKNLYNDLYNSFGKYGETVVKSSYTVYNKNNILSIVLRIDSGVLNGGITFEYKTYNFNLETLKKADMFEVAQKCGFKNKEDLNKAIDNSLLKAKKDLNASENAIRNDDIYYINNQGAFNTMVLSMSEIGYIELRVETSMINVENKELSPNQATSTENVDEKPININDYIGTWYTDKRSYGYDDLILSKDEKNNLKVEFNTYRLRSFDKLNASLSGDTITFKGYDYNDDVSGTIKLEQNRIVLNYETTSSSSSESQELIFNYLINNKVTEEYERENPVGTLQIIDKDDSSFIFHLNVTSAIKGQEYPNGNVNTGGVTGVAYKNKENTYTVDISSGYAQKMYVLTFTFVDDNTIVVTESEGFSAESGYFGANVYATGTYKK